jgi:TPR repeat protein
VTRTTRTVLGAIIAMLVVASTAVAGPLEEAWAAYGRDDYTTTMRILRPLAEQRNVRAQYWLGFMFEYGQAVPQNDTDGAGGFLPGVRWADFGVLDRNHASRPNQIEIKRDAACHRETPRLP